MKVQKTIDMGAGTNEDQNKEFLDLSGEGKKSCHLGFEGRSQNTFAVISQQKGDGWPEI